jgi:C-terminal peptidase prc
MKKLLPIIFASILFFWFSFAANLNFEDFLVVYFEWVSINLEKSWINTDELCQNTLVKYTNVSPWTQLYEALQKGICLNLFPNIAIPLPLSDYLTQDKVAQLLSSNFKNQISYSKWDLIDTSWTKELIDQTSSILWWNGENKGNSSEILDDVKYRLQNQSIYSSGVDWDNKKCSNITWCVDLIDDDYTEFYNSDQAQDLYESLEWEFSWIWAYLGTDGHGLFGITEIVEWWPAEKAGLKAWDIFVQIDDYVLTKNSTLDVIRSHIKWDIWTKVYIKIKRWNQYLEFNIKRSLISLPNIDYEILGWGICFMSIKQFNEKTLDQFEAGLRNFYLNNCKVYLFDLRDNAWWELNTVVNMLNHFVNSGDTIVQMRYNDFTENIVANWYGEKIKNKSIFMFVNEMTASASEIFVWTIKDYVKNSVLVWSKTYGKWSAQTLVQYTDGSILKYTIAKWYTGKSNKNIDGVWFNPDVTLRPDQVTSLINALKSKK